MKKKTIPIPTDILDIIQSKWQICSVFKEGAMNDGGAGDNGMH